MTTSVLGPAVCQGSRTTSQGYFMNVSHTAQMPLNPCAAAAPQLVKKSTIDGPVFFFMYKDVEVLE